MVDFKRTRKKEFRLSAPSLLLTFVISVCIALSGCAIWKVSTTKMSEINSTEKFIPRVAASQNAIPVPIEVASDISSVMFESPEALETVMNAKGSDSDQKSDDSKADLKNPMGLSEKNSEDLTKVAQDNATNPKSTTPAPTPDATKEIGKDSASADATIEAFKKSLKSTSSSKHRGLASKYRADFKYVVHRGDTLMKIAFEQYGNLYRWREIFDGNKGKLQNKNYLLPGMILNIAGSDYIVVEKNGLPYLIQRNDTLMKISKTIYKTSSNWKALWKNNRQLIIDPNKIYAGFTLYYEKRGE